jgi:AraC-like DNA-binding protein
MSRAQFNHAASLLRLIFQHVQTSTLADLRMEDLTRAQQAVLELRTVAARLRAELNGLAPAYAKTPPTLQPENRAEQVVHALMECIERSYGQPVTLRQCARQLGLNAAYLSALFARVVGVPFKTYLTALRMEKARRLLSHPSGTVCEVAAAVGYASENRFRTAFKKATGLAPRIWRETLRMQPLALAGWLLDEMELLGTLKALLLF